MNSVRVSLKTTGDKKLLTESKDKNDKSWKFLNFTVIQGGVPKHRAPFHIVLVYFCLSANVAETFYTLTIRRPKYSTGCYKGCEN